MKLDFEKFIKQSESVKMTAEEKSRIFNYLKSYADENPVREIMLASHSSWSNQFNQFRFMMLKPMPILLLLAILVGGGTSFAAERTLPGDILYPVKIAVNENVSSWLAISDDAQAKLETKLAVRRLEEAEKLSVDSKMSEDIRLRLEENFQEHADKITARIQKFQADDSSKAFEVASQFKTSLNAHARIMENIGTSLNGDVEPQLTELTTHIRTTENNMAKDEGKNENDLKVDVRAGVKTSAEGKLKAATNKLNEVKKFIILLNDRLDADTKARVDARLKVSEDLLAQGKVKLDAETYGEAFILFQKAQNIAQEAKLLVKAKADFDNSDSTDSSPTPKPSRSATPRPSRTPTPSIRIKSNSNINTESETGDDNVNIRGKVRINVSF